MPVEVSCLLANITQFLICADSRPRLSRTGMVQQLLPLGLESTVLVHSHNVTVISLTTSHRPQLPSIAYQDAVLVLTRTHLLLLSSDMQAILYLPLQGNLQHSGMGLCGYSMLLWNMRLKVALLCTFVSALQ